MLQTAADIELLGTQSILWIQH